MRCQYSSGCNNVGAYNCTKCGKMYCGMHTHFASTSSTPIVCEDCQQVAREEDRKVTKEAQKGSCIYLLIGILLFIIGASIANYVGWLGGIFIVIGIIGAGLGALGSLSWLG